jgi:hypothetical protein
MARGLNFGLMIGHIMAVWHNSFLPDSSYPMIKKQTLIRWECGMVMLGSGYSPGLDLCEEEILVY